MADRRAGGWARGNRNAKYGPYLQIRKYLGLYFAVFTVNKAKYMPPNSYLAPPNFVFNAPGRSHQARPSLAQERNDQVTVTGKSLFVPWAASSLDVTKISPRTLTV